MVGDTVMDAEEMLTSVSFFFLGTGDAEREEKEKDETMMMMMMMRNRMHGDYIGKCKQSDAGRKVRNGERMTNEEEENGRTRQVNR
ncbi:hypothetical protein RUM44_004756 [Polyplax serrata]|uniref:Uncharacterized protein n=1 Tax=Polyplax serrata TaxID=468196 RepID=A0ABR1B3R3_POLSC